ncbi:MAG: hypothetical protein ACYCU0_09645 [Solirubrobacteraceae bacterium]
MSVWVLLLLLGVVKIPIAALLVWMPFRSDRAAMPGEVDGEDGESPSDEGDGGGGSKKPQSPPRGPHPRSPLRRSRRRGSHGAPSSPRRVRLPVVLPRRRVVTR